MEVMHAASKHVAGYTDDVHTQRATEPGCLLRFSTLGSSDVAVPGKNMVGPLGRDLLQNFAALSSSYNEHSDFQLHLPQDPSNSSVIHTYHIAAMPCGAKARSLQTTHGDAARSQRALPG